MKSYDVIVVGSGHAGVEAAYAAARLGCRVLIVTVRWDCTAHMSCNPSIGGLGKGHIVKELDVLGGVMARAADASCIQFKKLNRSKGPAVRGSRAQCDKVQYSLYVQQFLSAQLARSQSLASLFDFDPACLRISYLSTEVKSLIFKKNYCQGVITDKGDKIYARAVVLTTGTFMKARMHVGERVQAGGRAGEKATEGLSDQLKSLGFSVYRLKTGTPPRLKKSSIDFSVLSPQAGDKVFQPFSFFSLSSQRLPKKLCYLAYTNRKTHELIYKNLNKSPLYTGAIQARGPRYCPSVEDKITCFPDKTQHQSFLEPETVNGESIYLQGLSTSLPVEVQLAFLRTIKGLSHVEILRPGYAVEYDFFDPQQLFSTLETKPFKALFFAGQINGSSGYEEAAGQGLIAGINAACLVKNKEPLILKRQDAYIGVLIDDLTTKGTKEPYRMLTSRAEYRLLLREDNAIERLFDISEKYQLLNDQQLKLLSKQLNQRKKLAQILETTQLVPSRKTQYELQTMKTTILSKPQSLKNILCRPEISWLQISQFLNKRMSSSAPFSFSRDTWESVEIRCKYEGYIQRQTQLLAKNRQMEDLLILGIDYDQVKGLSREALEKLKQVQPRTLASAGRISGMPPVAIQAILIYLKTNQNHSFLGSKKLSKNQRI